MFGPITAGKIRAFWIVGLTSVFVGVSPEVASADFMQIIDGNNEFSQSGATFAGTIDVTFADTGMNEVTLTISAANLLTTTAKISEFYFNIVDTRTALQVNQIGFGGAGIAFSSGDFLRRDPNGNMGHQNQFKADGDGIFDFRLNFATSDGAAFEDGETFQIKLQGIGFTLTAADFDSVSFGGPVGKNGFEMAAHVQAVTGGSGWFSGEDPPPETPQAVPLPASVVLALGALGSFGLVGLRRRFRSRKGQSV